jgi:hypothetical protein
MPTNSQPNTSASNAREQNALPGEIGMAITWVVFYAIVLIAPLAAKIAPVSTVVALLTK